MLHYFDHRKQINELRQDLDTLRKSFKNLELEWADMYDRIHRTLMKISKRAQRSDDAERAEGVENPPPGDTPSTLTGRTAEIQRRILARREGRNDGLLPR
jgi:predicted  nucleic acid-binding Zn-ribbon protein